MSKNKYIYGAVCKSQPVPNPGAELTENLPETKWRAAQKQSIKKANFLFFQIFVSLVILMMPTTLWADLVSLTVDSGGDTVFRGEVDRLRIIFTVDDDTDDGDPYIVEVGNTVPRGDGTAFVSLGVIEQGSVSANETVNVFWDGTIDGAQLPDKEYTIRVTVDEDEAKPLTATATLDTSVPRVSGVIANGNPDLLITEGGFIKEPLRSITVTGADDDDGIDLGNRRTTVFLRNERQAVVRGTTTYDDTGITFTLINPLDIPSENGKYTLILILIDKAGNVIQSVREFTFDNVKPSLKRVSTNRGGLIPGAGISQRLNYVDATLTDNLEAGIDLFASTIQLIGLDGTTVIPGEKTEDPESDKIRWSLLTPLLGRDDSQDGEYTIKVTAVDKAGNEAEPIRVTFLYDNRGPRLVSLRPLQSGESFNFVDDTVHYNLPIRGFVATFEDIGIGVDLTDRRQSTRIVFGTPKESGDELNVRGGRVATDSDTDTLTYILNKPIVNRDGSQDGRYTLNVQAADTAGNTKTYNYQLIYDTQLPTLVSTTPAANETVSALSQVQVKLNEETSGIDFVGSNFQLTRFDATQGTAGAPVEVPVNITSNGIDTATLTLTKPIALDGSDDGTYTIEVTPTDRAGNTGIAAVREFYLVSQKHEPKIRLTMPGTTTVSSLPTIVVELIDYVGAGIDFDASTVAVKNPQGILVPEEALEHDGTSMLTWTAEVPVARDGSADGEYIVTATFVDFTGRRFTQEFPIVLDTQVPEIESVHVAIESQPELSTDNITTLTESFSQIIVTFENTLEDSEQGAQAPSNDIDFTDTVVELTGSAGPIPSNVSVYSPTQLAIRFVELIEDGSYTLLITPQDIAGNTARGAVRYAFLLDTESPRITASSPLTLSEPVSYIGGNFRQFVFTIEDVGPADLFFQEQTVALLDASGNTVPAALTYNELTSQLYLTIVSPFAQDGSSDGEYTVKISLVDKAGNRLDSEHTVVYDSKVPQLSSVVLNTEPPIVLEPQLIKMISETVSSITLQFEEATRIDFTNTVVELTRPGPEGPILIPSNISVDSFTQLTIRFVELMEDGSYTLSVTPRDVAGNTARGAIRYAFLLDTESPRISGATPETPLVFNQQPVTYIGSGLRQFQFVLTVEDVGPAGLYLEQQTIEVLDASGANIPIALTYEELTSQLYLALPASLPRDGSADGEYTVKISLVDKAGNRSDSEYTVVYDSKAPQLTSAVVNTDPPIELVPNRIAEIVESINSISVQFEEATRIDFANTQITLMGPELSSSASDESTTPSIPLTLEDDGVSQMTLSFLDLEQIGSYTLSVTPQDVAGNAAAGAVDYRFTLEIPLPRISSVVIGGIETEAGGDVVYVNASNMIIGAFLLDPTETGLSFGSEGSYITVTEPDGTTIVPGATGSNGEDLIVWEPITLTSDGTTDGRYNVYVVPVDKAGRRGSTVYREFIYDTQDPEIQAAEPINLSQPVSYSSQSLTQLSFTIADIGPADLELSDQKVTLSDASGALVPTQLTNDTENQLFLTLDQPLPLDGSMDGEYTVLVELADKAGNSYTVEHLIVYDTQAPTLVSTVPADGALLTEDVTQTQVTLNDEGGSGIDWAVTTVTLVDPNGTEISGELVSDGETALTLTTNQLVADGRYIIRVQAVDRAGNGDAVVFERSFLLSRHLPAIVSTEPITAPADEAFMNEELERIEVTLETDDENHLSTLRLLNPGTQVVVGQLQRANDRLIYNLVRPLATDGSEDGVYTIEFTPISASGRSGEVQRLTFTYDTQAPEIEPDEAISLVVAEPEVNNSLTEIHVNLTDETSGIDWKNLDEKWLTFERLSPNPTKISGRISDDGQDNLTFRLTVPLADNGSADGEYRITLNPKDRAGNDDEPYEKVFIYDTSPPMIDPSTLLINDAPLLVDINAENYPTAVSTTGGAVIQANIFDTGLGVNLAQSKIIVTSPDGSEISGSTQQNGVDTLIFKSNGLTIQGVYKVTVMSIGNDSELLGFAPTDSLTTEFLYETTVPTAAITSDGGETELTDKALPLEGTASDPSGTQRSGDGEIPVPASGVWLVEIVGTGPDKQPIDPVATVDDSNAEQEPWSVWSIDFLPTRSGEYDLDVRVTDNAGNYEIYDIGEYTMSVSLTFRGTTFGWPNPLRLSKRDVAFFSFDVNVPRGETIELTLSIYDWSGDMVLSETYPDVVSGQRNDQLVKWNLENQAGASVARGIYVFRLEAVNSAGNHANVVGKVLVVD